MVQVQTSASRRGSQKVVSANGLGRERTRCPDSRPLSARFKRAMPKSTHRWLGQGASLSVMA